MAHAYFIVHLDKYNNEIKGSDIYSEWPLSRLLSGTRYMVDACIFSETGETYDEARNKLVQKLLSFPTIIK